MQHYKRLQKISFLLLFSATHTMFGQFNTLSPQLQPEKKKYAVGAVAQVVQE